MRYPEKKRKKYHRTPHNLKNGMTINSTLNSHHANTKIAIPESQEWRFNRTSRMMILTVRPYSSLMLLSVATF
jgi:hypothetical protein